MPASTVAIWIAPSLNCEKMDDSYAVTSGIDDLVVGLLPIIDGSRGLKLSSEGIPAIKTFQQSQQLADQLFHESFCEQLLERILEREKIRK